MKLPNIRKLFSPDPGYVMFDCDLSGADAQVVAWEAEDADLKAAFRAGLKVHIKNFEDLYQRKFDPVKDKKETPKGHIYPPYDSLKRAVHGTNYGASARTVAITLGWPVADAERFQANWFKLHPGIKDWHRRVEDQLQRTRTVSNKFGYRRIYFDRMDNLLPEGLAWIPQSTVAIVCSTGGCKLLDKAGDPSIGIAGDPSSALFGTRMLLQVHDSLVFQSPIGRVTPQYLNELRNILTITVPYVDPLTIGWEATASTRSWGECKALKWDGSNLEEILQ
jgi:DNA polymerase-1